jgi:long-chain fatty acid transport protein
MSARVRTLALVAAACAGLGSAPMSHANPNDYFGFGARAIGFGGAFGALADDFSANYYNPAGLATNDALQIELGYMYVAPSLRLNDGDLDVDTVHGFQGGLVVPGKVWGHQLGLSIGLHLPDQECA